MKTLSSAVVLLSLVLLASAFAESKEFCARDAATIADIAREPSARMSFVNPGGYFGIGLCWWHSRFQRAAWYLIDFKPELARDNGDRRAKYEIRMLADQSGVVTIPGYSDFATYSRHYQKLIEKELSDWQVRDSIEHGTWVLKPTLRSSLPADELRAKLAKVREQFVAGKGQPIFQMIQIRNSSAIHAWLLLGITEESGGFRMQVVDSNYPDAVHEAVYVAGETTVRYDRVSGDGVIPYEYFGDQARIDDAIDRHCR